MLQPSFNSHPAPPRRAAEPFGYDANDLPLEEYILDLEATLFQQLPSSRAALEATSDNDDSDNSDDGGLSYEIQKVITLPPPPSGSTKGPAAARPTGGHHPSVLGAGPKDDNRSMSGSTSSMSEASTITRPPSVNVRSPSTLGEPRTPSRTAGSREQQRQSLPDAQSPQGTPQQQPLDQPHRQPHDQLRQQLHPQPQRREGGGVAELAPSPTWAMPAPVSSPALHPHERGRMSPEERVWARFHELSREAQGLVPSTSAYLVQATHASGVRTSGTSLRADDAHQQHDYGA